jgi:hypothetical protein
LVSSVDMSGGIVFIISVQNTSVLYYLWCWSQRGSQSGPVE